MTNLKYQLWLDEVIAEHEDRSITNASFICPDGHQIAEYVFQSMNEKLEAAQKRSANELFKKLVKDAKAKFEPTREGMADNRPIMSYGSQRPSFFEKSKKTEGRFYHLTDEYIDKLSGADLENEMVMFIYTCFQQR